MKKTIICISLSLAFVLSSCESKEENYIKRYKAFVEDVKDNKIDTKEIYTESLKFTSEAENLNFTKEQEKELEKIAIDLVGESPKIMKNAIKDMSKLFEDTEDILEEED